LIDYAGFLIPVDNSFGVEVVKSDDQLCRVELSCFEIELVGASEVKKQFAFKMYPPHFPDLPPWQKSITM
jgi:hypothetical protein